MNGQNCCGVERIFNSHLAERELQDYRAHGPGKSTRLLIEALKATGIEGLTLLDIGGGIGAIQHELITSGVNRAISIDASSAYLHVSRQEAERQGYVQRITYHHGDFVDLAPQLPPADIVTLDKVICCYPDMRALVGLSAARAAKLYGVIFPRDAWWLKVGWRAENLLLWLERNPFRTFVHPVADVEAVIRANGLERRYERKTILWQVMIFAR